MLFKYRLVYLLLLVLLVLLSRRPVMIRYRVGKVHAARLCVANRMSSIVLAVLMALAILRPTHVVWLLLILLLKLLLLLKLRMLLLLLLLLHRPVLNVRGRAELLPTLRSAIHPLGRTAAAVRLCVWMLCVTPVLCRRNHHGRRG